MEGERLGPYLIDRELGAGGMGRVLRATGPDGVVALKVVHPHLLESDDSVARFRREIEIGRTIRHPNVVRTLGGGEADGRHFLVMEYVEGQTLDALREEVERVPEELCLQIGGEVTKGLAAIHAAGALHRDIKPENVLITPEHDVKIMDLGVARMVDDALRLSQTGAFVGSLQYAAPECFRPELGKADQRADLHALGLVLYELATGDAPYAAPDVHSSILRVLEEMPRRCGELNPQLSPFFEEVVHTLLVKDPRGRFSDAKELLSVLDRGESGAWWSARARALRVETKRPLRRVRVPRETAVYGRDEELASLRALFDRVKAGEGQVVVVDGEAGIGKSRLIDEFVGRLQADGEDLNFLFGGYPPNGAATADGAFSAAFRAHFGEDGCAAYLTESPALVPAFDAQLRRESPPAGTSRLGMGALQMCFAQATAALAAERPTIVLVEDLHFAPDRARALFSALATDVQEERVLLIGTTRPTEDDSWSTSLDRFGHVTKLSPSRLSARDVATLLEDVFRSKVLAESLGYQIIVKSDGNPFFAFEIIRGLRDGNLITRRDDGTWTSTEVIESIEVPSTVAELVTARVAALDDDARNLLDVAACLGFEFDAGLLAEAMGMGRIPVLQTLAKIEKRERAVRSVGRHFAFDHHQIQEVLYDSMPEMLREEYHGAIGDVLLTRCPDEQPKPGTDGARRWVDACDHLVRAARWDDALPLLDRALLYLKAESRLGHVRRLAEQALAVPGALDGSPRARVLMDLFEARSQGGLLSEREAIVAEAMRCAEQAGDREMQLQTTMAHGALLQARGDLPAAMAAHRRALDFATEDGATREAAGATVNVGNILMAMGRLEAARETYEQGRELCRAAAAPRYETIVVTNLAVLAWQQDRLAESLVLCGDAVRLAEQQGDKRMMARVRATRAAIHVQLADFENARSACADAVATAREIGDGLSRSEALLALGFVLLEEGDVSGAVDALESAIRDSEGAVPYIEVESRMRLGELRVGQGSLQSGRDELERALALATKVGLGPHAARAYVQLAALDAELVGAARSTVEAEWEGMRLAERRDVSWHLFRATGEQKDLLRAKETLDEILRRVDSESAKRMRTGIRRHREILAAWQAEVGDDDDPGPSAAP